jgi:hypothetical protein
MATLNLNRLIGLIGVFCLTLFMQLNFCSLAMARAPLPLELSDKLNRELNGGGLIALSLSISVLAIAVTKHMQPKQ